MTTINVPRELLERLLCVIDFNGYRSSEVETVDELRALLAERPQAGAGQDVPDVVRQFVESQTVCSDCHLDEACCRPLLRAAKEAFAAAPQPPARPDQGDEVRRLREALEAIQSRASNLMDDELFDMCDAALTQSPKGEEE